jgi:DHA1 family bicyclomycin/chloramphenicol resistance-like MFS transporter
MELLVPSFPQMKRVFEVNDGQIQQLLTVNFTGFQLGVLLVGALCDSLGRKKVLVYGSWAYVFVSLLSALAVDFPTLMVCRFLQGATMTAPVIAGGVIMMEVTAGAKQVFWMSLGNAAITFCMAMAPLVGSWVNGAFGFRGNLWCILILGCAGILPALVFVPETLSPEKKKKLSLGPIFKGYGALLQDVRFMTLAVPVCGLAAAYWVYVGVSALYMVDYLGVDAADFGRYQGPIVGCFSVVSLSSSWLLRRFGLKTCLKMGNLCMGIGCTSLLVLSLAFESALATTLCMIAFVGGMAPVCSMLFPYSMGHLPAELQGSAQALLQSLRLFLASIGSFVLGFLYHGPLLPVACILMVCFAASMACMWLGRGFLEGDTGHGPVAGH